MTKNGSLFHFLGTADELNSHLGLVKAMLMNENSWQVSWGASCHFLEKIQKNLMKVMSHAADTQNGKFLFTDNDVAALEKEIDKLKKNIPAITGFTVPGKNIIEAQIQIARTVARRAERYFTALGETLTPKHHADSASQAQLCPKACVYLNRLSDYLFYLSQQESLINVNFINQVAGV